MKIAMLGTRGVPASYSGFETCVEELGSRLAQRVLIEVAAADYRHEDDLYALAQRIDWSTWITPQHTGQVSDAAGGVTFVEELFCALKLRLLEQCVRLLAFGLG